MSRKTSNFLAGTVLFCVVCFLVPELRVLWKVGLYLLVVIIVLVICFLLLMCYHYWRSEHFRQGVKERLKRIVETIERERQAEEEGRLSRERAEAERLRLERLKPRSLNTEQVFSTQSPANFDLAYRLRILIEAPNADTFDKAGLVQGQTQAALAAEYNANTFQEFLRENSYHFHFGWSKTVAGDPNQGPYAKADVFCENERGKFFRDIAFTEFEEKLRKVALTKNGCRISADGIEQNLFPEEMIERNYAMLTDRQKEEIEKDERYSEFDEILTIAALKRRLEFYNAHYRQSYDSRYVSIKTERIGSGFKISWLIKEHAPARFDLVGFRRTGGFHHDEFDLDNNGALIIQSRQSNETTDPLKEGETYFYTFYLKPWNKDDQTRYPVARFQITIMREETEAIQATLRRIEQKRAPDPAKEHISLAKKEIDLYMEFDTVLAQLEKTRVAEIQAGNYTDREKKDKVLRFQAFVASIRQKYEQNEQ